MISIKANFYYTHTRAQSAARTRTIKITDSRAWLVDKKRAITDIHARALLISCIHRHTRVIDDYIYTGTYKSLTSSRARAFKVQGTDK